MWLVCGADVGLPGIKSQFLTRVLQRKAEGLQKAGVSVCGITGFDSPSLRWPRDIIQQAGFICQIAG